MARTEVRGGQILDSSVDLTQDVTGVLPTAKGGTGLSTPGASGNVLTSNGSTWQSSAPSGGGSSNPALTLQTNDIGNYNGSSQLAQTMYGVLIPITQSINVTQLYYYLNNKNATNPTMEVGIYDSSGNKLVSATHTPTTTGLQTVPITTTLLNAGSSYYLAVLNRTSGDTTTTIPAGSNNSGIASLAFTISSQATMPATATLTSGTNQTFWIAASGAFAGSNASPLTTKGDIFGYSTAPARVPVGVDGSVLAADSGNARGVSYQNISFQQRRNQQASINPGATTLSTFGMAAAPVVTSGIAATNADGVDGPMLNISSTAVAANVASIASAFTQLRRDWDFDVSIRIKTPAGSTTAYRYWIGLFSAAPSGSDTPAVHIAGFRFVSTGAQGNANFQGITAAGGTLTTVDTGVALAASTVYTLRVVSDSVAGTISFYINGKYVGQSTTNLPTSTQLLGHGVYATALAAAAAVIQWSWTSIMSK